MHTTSTWVVSRAKPSVASASCDWNISVCTDSPAAAPASTVVVPRTPSRDCSPRLWSPHWSPFPRPRSLRRDLHLGRVHQLAARGCRRARCRVHRLRQDAAVGLLRLQQLQRHVPK
ncbi:hypothetical protein F442_11146 [Phytophthora nicotianae P10297]|uniref:Uncharacterized protein n=3 Tax=Phytophthora nicotianae TaxID=4792 RepID=V9EYR0_PHYNI|nr:hypothetical protein F443_11238 [Phytophthora nicotianae P1569]ETM43905.1 hypothetical protein L914_10788 [Phytophthora nicotianae]ETP41872.1 hypothetical protein F442_11146 [Phytophthora nicotianae P10297]